MNTKEKLSEIEVKLINATIKFIKGSECFIDIKESHDPLHNDFVTIGIKPSYLLDSNESNYAEVEYLDNANKGKITVGGRANMEKYQRIYKKFLIQEIPEIKNRIKLF